MFGAEAKEARICDRDDLRDQLFVRIGESCGSHTRETWDLVRTAAASAIPGVGVAHDWHGGRGSEGISIVLDMPAPWLAQQAA